MPELEILARFILALGFGAILGLETETRAIPTNEKERDLLERERLGGVRTYTTLSLFGALSGLMFAAGYEIFAYLMFIAIATIVLAAYVLNVQYRQAFGMTTEVSILTTVLISFAATADIVSVQILIVLGIVLAFILSQKRGISSLAKRLAHQELEDVVKFLIAAVVVLPFLPDINIYLSQIPVMHDLLKNLGAPETLLNSLVILNPFRLWQYVLLISGFNLIGYFAHKTIGKHKGLLITGIFGGFVSSTATVVVFAHKAKHNARKHASREFAAIALVANGVSFIPMTLLASSINAEFGYLVLMMGLILLIASLIYATIIFATTKTDSDSNVDTVKYTPFSLGPAVEFVILLTLVRIAVQIAKFYFGDGAFLLVTALTGLIGVDVATISIAELVSAGTLTVPFALFAFLITNLVNFGAKTFYAYTQGDKYYAKSLAQGLAIIGAIACLGFVVLR